ncbi:PREDICTED: uncharacterized protein LOC109237835 [Nicotiana attenuata]|uniref:uncharacterized protein LOC109237835 n=1 Tax=Nicotiana attenuata TaxID=49451 RepID=UPI0009056214|nr:PREDICTED: uncharacterized protein LOC109237835 [Nicotiana attenuata]
MAKTSKTVPQKEKASSSSFRPAGDKTPVELLPHEYVPGPCVLKSDFKVENSPSVPGRCEHVSRYICSIKAGNLEMPHAVPDLEDWVRKLALTSSHADRCWHDLSRGRWEAKNHEVTPKPAKDKKRRRASPSDTPKPKKNKARKSKDDSAALSADVAQKLRDEEEEGGDAGCELVPRKRGSVEASKAVGLVMVEETHPRTEEISEGAPSKVPESSGAEDISCRDEQPARVPEGSGSGAFQKGESAPSDFLGAINIDYSPPGPEFSEGQFQKARSMETPNVVMLHREAFTKSQTELNRCEVDLKRLTEERDALKRLYVQKEEEIRDLRADLAQARKEEAELDEQVTILLKEYGLDPTVEANTSISQLQQKLERIELLRGEVDQIKADCDRWNENMDHLAAEKESTLAKLSSAEVQLRSIKEKSSAQAKRIEELEAELAEAGKTKTMANKSIAVYLADAEAAQTETLEEIHARGFDLSKEIAQAKALEVDAGLLVSSDDDDDDEGSQGGSDNDEGPEGEAAPEGETSPGHS